MHTVQGTGTGGNGNTGKREGIDLWEVRQFCF